LTIAYYIYKDDEAPRGALKYKEIFVFGIRVAAIVQ